MSDTDTVAPEAVEQQNTPEAPVDEPQAPSQSPDELNALKRQLAEAERRAKRLEQEQKKAAEAKAAEEGRWQELAQQREAELNQERMERVRVEREQRIARLASSMKFIDPTDAVLRVGGEDGDSDEAARAALERVAEQSPHLIQKEPPARPEIGQVLEPSAPTPSAPQPPAGKAPLRSQADVEALSDAEFNARYAEVQAVLRQ